MNVIRRRKRAAYRKHEEQLELARYRAKRARLGRMPTGDCSSLEELWIASQPHRFRVKGDRLSAKLQRRLLRLKRSTARPGPVSIDVILADTADMASHGALFGKWMYIEQNQAPNDRTITVLQGGPFPFNPNPDWGRREHEATLDWFRRPAMEFGWGVRTPASGPAFSPESSANITTRVSRLMDAGAP